MNLEFELEYQKSFPIICEYKVLRKGLCVGKLILQEEYKLSKKKFMVMKDKPPK